MGFLGRPEDGPALVAVRSEAALSAPRGPSEPKGALMVCAVVAAAGVLATLIRGDEQQPAGVAVGPAGAPHET